MANKKKKQRHLTLTDRTYIEQELVRGSSFTDIGLSLGKDPSTIAKEVKLHYEVRQPTKSAQGCSNCTKYNVCNGCTELQTCHLEKHLYRARTAQAEYEATLVKSRVGINMTPEELAELDSLISPLIKRGQPLSHIFAVHADEIPVCRRTLYNYLDQRVFEARNIDLHRRVRYKKRRKKHNGTRDKNFLQMYRNKRTYKDFEFYMKHHPDASIVELDTVKGTRTAGKCLMTLLFRSCNFMIIILLSRCSQECIINAFNNLVDTLTPRLFRKYFEVILTDNGPEFKNPWDIEKG